MKIKLTFLMLIMIAFSAQAQTQQAVHYSKISDPVFFKTMAQPWITGYGQYSDSLANLNNGTIFFEHNGTYFPITTWADYHRWFIKKFWYKFEEPALFEYFYLTENDYGMALYLNKAFTGTTWVHGFQVMAIDPNVAISEYEARKLAQLKEKSYASIETKNDYNNFVAELDASQFTEKELRKMNRKNKKLERELNFKLQKNNKYTPTQVPIYITRNNGYASINTDSDKMNKIHHTERSNYSSSESNTNSYNHKTSGYVRPDNNIKHQLPPQRENKVTPIKQSIK